MVSAVGPSPAPGAASPSGAGLDYQLAKYQSQLSDWQNCPSCTTPEGKAKIREISDKINEIEQQLKAADAAKANRASAAGATADGTAAAGATATVTRSGMIGSRLDVFA